MPFIAGVRRWCIERYGISNLFEVSPGDRCYVHYKRMVDRWRIHPRWTTAHEIYTELLQAERPKYPCGPRESGDGDWDDFASMFLAWQVFFLKYVMPYEDLKEKENGEI